ncbi:hypothetical protein [Ancylobacter polymorphus]|uniref:Uncharacterized protein n=1 Tax=Ancylobacter polymorphus TaxID=223390 RepID=A0A9E7D7Q8_9HYPH|nr:hypothetical protein [Ancylobacter polymorphus]UOK72426.1 hypothetical protein K9D25_06915 [Ancylobacter polymorphus]
MNPFIREGNPWPQRTALSFALGLIAAIAVIWFINSFFVLDDENPRSSLSQPQPALTRSAAL